MTELAIWASILLLLTTAVALRQKAESLREGFEYRARRPGRLLKVRHNGR